MFDNIPLGGGVGLVGLLKLIGHVYYYGGGRHSCTVKTTCGF